MADNHSAGLQTNPAGGERGGRRRGSGRGGASHNPNRTDNRRNEGGRAEGGEPRNYRGRGGGGRRGRGHSHGHGNERNNPPRTATSGGGGQPPGEDPDGPGTSGDHPTGDAIKGEGEAATTGKQLVAEAATDEPDDGEVCFICASTVEHTSVAPCNHRTCHICALRLRALYKNKACAHCRVC